jgi:uncharacterized protein
VFGLFLLGLALGRVGFFADPARFARGRAAALALSLIVIPFLVYARTDSDGEPRGLWLWTHLFVSGWADLVVMFASALVFVLLWESGWDRLLGRLVPAGRMTLTLYIGQSLLFVPFFYGFGLHMYDRIDEAASLAIGIGAFALQLAFATWWFRHFHYGPLEWLWRAGTKLSLQVPFRRRADRLERAA